ncbi:flagellar biosynthesis protein FlhB [Sphaerotilus sp.]|jgi:flagellar biosynthesis protein FlhB|uniref:flagellar biosynthesis protein FlhB n=1 Tax=Sphaerotilus sp. TaxID=2093942 RepID=UPI0025D0C49D|nr:flagellar biosynthesis protein FlhB [Sphaerotilus sp.]
MSGDSSQDKQLPATAQRLEKARAEGQVVRSRDLAHCAVVAASLGVIGAVAPSVTQRLRDLLAAALRFDAVTVASPAFMAERLASVVPDLLLLSLFLGGVVCAVAVVSALVSGGWVFTLSVLAPNFGKLNPLSGLVNLLSKDNLSETLKSSVLALLLGVVGALWLWAHQGDFVRSQSVDLTAAFTEAGSQILSGLWLLVLVLALFAVIDLPLQRFLHASKLKMSHQDIKEEHKQQDGNPEIKGRLRQRMREASRRRMMAAVPKADLVVMNPSHYAVAIQYSEDSGGAPKVVAKGTDQVAMRIRDLATASRVPVLEAPPLARALYATTELDREIPVALYSAVAQVLAHVFRLREAVAGRAPYPDALDPIAVPPELDPADPRHNRHAARTGSAPTP